MTRGAKLLIVATVIALASGCGGGSSDTSQIRSALTSYLRAVADGNGRRACDQLTGEGARIVLRVTASVGVTSCVDAIDKLGQNLRGDERRTLRDAKVVSRPASPAREIRRSLVDLRWDHAAKRVGRRSRHCNQNPRVI